MRQRKKNIILSLLLLSVGIAGTMALSRQQSTTQKLTNIPTLVAENISAVVHNEPKTKQQAIAEPDTGENKEIEQSTEAASAEEPVVKGQKAATSVQYLSMDKEGIIGAYAGKQLDNPSDNIFTVQLDKAPGENDQVWLSYDLSGVADYTNIPHSVNDRLATGGYLVKKTNRTTRQKEQIDPFWLKKGDNMFQFGLPENAGFGYRVSNLIIEVEPEAKNSALVVNSTATSYDNKTYISGFAQSKNAFKATFEIDGKTIKNTNGSFEALIVLNNERKVEVKAIYPNGNVEKKEIAFTKDENPDIEFAMNTHIAHASKTFIKGAEGNLKLSTALLQIEPSALLANTKNISITTLRDIDIPALNMGMSNVTDGSKGYRFLPHGEHFADGATVTIKYDRTKIPNGFTEDDIKTFYFDLDTKNWVTLERDSIDKNNQLIVSRTTHFTDMINGVIQTPESPETQGFAPTTMHDIKAADPTAKVQLIEAPSANNRGSANTGYGFEMPPARNGMVPQMGIQYNSDGGSGWLGEGWDLSTSSISIDTRWEFRVMIMTRKQRPILCPAQCWLQQMMKAIAV